MASKQTSTDELPTPCDLATDIQHQTQQIGANPIPGYQYLDHTADVQLHAWGATIEQTFEQCCLAMFGYITELQYVSPTRKQIIKAEGHDLISLLYNFLDEYLFQFSAESFFVPKEIKVIEFDSQNFNLTSESYGETFDLNKHVQGTEVKAITYSNMQMLKDPNGHFWQCFVIIDI